MRDNYNAGKTNRIITVEILGT